MFESATSAQMVIDKLQSINEHQVEAKFHDKINTSKGSIYCPLYKNLSDAELLEGFRLFDNRIIAVKQIVKTNNNISTRTGRMLITFQTSVAPQIVIIMCERFQVSKWYPAPLRCRRCHQLRHHESNCKHTPCCRTCGIFLADNDMHECRGILCITSA